MPIELILRRASLTPSSYDPDTGTIEAVISTGAVREMRDSQGVYLEELDLSGVDLDSLIGMPFLDGHRQDGAHNVLGVHTAAKRENGNIVVRIKLSDADDVRSTVQKIKEGVIRQTSIGYGVKRQSEKTEGGKRKRIIVPAIRESSLVALGADPGARIRSQNPMPKQTHETEDDVVETETAMPEAQQNEIRALGTLADLQPSVIDELITRNLSVADARTEIRAALTQRSQATPRIRVVSPPGEDPAVQLRHREEALHVRVAGGTPSEHARPYMGDRLLDHARAAVERMGISTRGWHADQIFERALSGAHGTSDFPQLLLGVGTRVLLPAYQAARSPLIQLARQVTVNDFRTVTRLKLSETGPLQKLTEHGEIKHTTRGEVSEAGAINTYGSIFAMSRKAWINDDLGAFRDWGNAAGQAAAQTEADLLWALLSQSSGAGPVMNEDSKRMFHADHGNLLTGAAVDSIDGDVPALHHARLAMRTQKGLDGKTPIALQPKFLLVGPESETAAEKALAAISPPSTQDANVFTGRFTVLVEPRIEDQAWYAFADPATAAVIELAHLASAQGPQLSSREGFEVLGREFRVTLDVGCWAVEWRGAVRNPGPSE